MLGHGAFLWPGCGSVVKSHVWTVEAWITLFIALEMHCMLHRLNRSALCKACCKYGLTGIISRKCSSWMEGLTYLILYNAPPVEREDCRFLCATQMVLFDWPKRHMMSLLCQSYSSAALSTDLQSKEILSYIVLDQIVSPFIPNRKHLNSNEECMLL